MPKLINVIKRISPAVFAVSFLFLIHPAQGAQGLQPVNLRCGARVDPLGIGDATPRLSWQLAGGANGARGEVQSAYEILVGSAPGASDLWDSGVVTSADTDIIYAGQPLAAGKPYYWSVQVQDGHGNTSDWVSAKWSMGLLSATNWTAQWIGYDAAYNLTPAQATNNALFNTVGASWISYSGQSPQNGIYDSVLRRQIVLPSGQAMTNAVLALYADNACNVYVNGQALTNSAHRWEATARLNVTPWMHAGTNQFALEATSSDAQESASVIGRLVVQFASGAVSNYLVDTSWKAAQWPSGNWMQTNYNDSGWSTPSSGGTPWGTPALNDLARVPAPYLRKNFSVAKTVTRATAYVTALGAYELHLNGQKVGNDVLTPGWTEFSKRVFYQTYDVTGMVQPGANSIGAILGDGWYASDLAFKGMRLNYGGTPRFLAQLAIQFSDGTTQTVTTDASWKASYGPIQWSDLLLGSAYDARQEMPGWDTAGFGDSAWSSVATGLSAAALRYTNVTALVSSLVSNNRLNFTADNTTMGGDPALNIPKNLLLIYSLGGVNHTNTYAENANVSLGGTGQTLLVLQAYYGQSSQFPGNGGLQIQAAVAEPARCFETLAATNLTMPSPGCYTFDLGQNMVGWVQLNISGQIGDRITIRHGEMLNPNGTVYTANLRGATATDFYIFGTNGTVVYQPRFTFHGFRYVEIRGLTVAPTLGSVTVVVVHSEMPRAGNFASSSPLLNQLYSNIIWGQKGNYLEIPTDCPQRDERMGWTGDTEFFVPTALYNYDGQAFYHRHLVTLCEDAQLSDGSYANVAPDLGAGSGAAAWGDAAWICTYNVYRAYGDTNVIVDHYASFQRYGQFLAAHASGYVISSLPGDFGDWLNLGGGATGKVIDTAFYAYYAQAMSEMAAAIGKTADAANYATLRANIANVFAGFFNSDGTFADGSNQAGYALAFTLDLVPVNLRALASQQFANSISQFGNHLATGFIGTPRLLPALHAAGHDDLAYQVLLQKTYPSWLYQVTLGATTMWERWDGWTPGGGFQTVGMNSFNHYSFGAVGQYMYDTVAGINEASPGYKTILIQPTPGSGLTWANGSYNSIRGAISTAWTNTGSMFDLEVVIPPNTTAQVFVPTTNAAAITESGVPAATSPGVSFLGTSNGCAVFGVGSGRYFWSSPIPATPSVPVVSETDSVYSAGNFPALWAGDLLTNKSVKVTANTLSFASENHLTAASLYDGLIGSPLTTNRSCEISGGAITFYLGPGTNGIGFTITNVAAYTAWQDDGRENANYAVNYSYDGTNFYNLATVAYNPSPYPTKDGTGGTFTSLSVSNLTGVQYLRWNFSASQQNGGVGYTEVAAYGTPGSVPTPSLAPGAGAYDPAGFILNTGGLVVGHTYQLQSKTNLTDPSWFPETNFIALQAAAALTNSVTNCPQKFYRLIGN